MSKMQLLVRMEIETPQQKAQRLMMHATAKALRRRTSKEVYPMLADAASAVNYEVRL